MRHPTYTDLGKPVGVSCYSGHRHATRPISFFYADRHYRVVELERSWYEECLEGGERKTCFRVRADDGNLYVLSRGENGGEWTLEKALYLC